MFFAACSWYGDGYFQSVGLHPVMRHVNDLDPGLPRGGDDRMEIGEQIDLLGDVLDPGPGLAVRMEEVVVEIDAEKRRDLGIIGRHVLLLRRTGAFQKK